MRLVDSARASAQSCAGNASVLLFDWDDTLLPTSTIRALRSPHRARWTQPLSSMDMQVHAELVEKVLRAARAVGHVSIVTLSKNNWVLKSAEKYLPALDMPWLIKELGITIYYAQEEEKNCPGALAAEDWAALKQLSMTRCLDAWRASGALAADQKPSVISIGDSDAEQEALKATLGAQAMDRPFCKTVKLMDEPSLDELSRQLQALPMWLERMAVGKLDFDLCILYPAELSARARALGL